MPTKVRTSNTMDMYELKVDSKTGKEYLSMAGQKTVDNPFLNMLDMVDYYLSIVINKDEELLKEIVGNSDSKLDVKLISNLDMYQFFIPNMFLSSINSAEDDEWIDFDFGKMDELLKHPFFDEYNRTLSVLKKTFKRIYPMLDVYSYVRLQAYASTILPKELLWDVNYIWTYEDFIVQIYGLGWFDTISIIYKSYGIHWFSNNAENDPILYKWACYAIAACKKIGGVTNEKLKRDLNDIYRELLIAFTIRGTLDSNVDIIEYVQSCITNFDDEHISRLIDSVESLQKQNKQLIDDKMQLNEGIKLLRSQLEELQSNDEKPDYDKVEAMAYRIYCLSPQTSEMEDKVDKFREIWDKLDNNTKKDIKLSISMFENFESFDLALFPMIRSLEHEFARNYFAPFQSSRVYKNAGVPLCQNNRYKKTHDYLVKRRNIYPTMGSISFIAKAMTDEQAQKASNIINAFKIFLGEKRTEFVRICKSLDKYRVGTLNYKLVDIRNGIAHGDAGIIQNVDKSCYEEVSRLLYEPPLQILFEIIKYSMK